MFIGEVRLNIRWQLATHSKAIVTEYEKA